MTPNKKWETLKMELANFSKKFAKNKSRKHWNVLRDLNRHKDVLQNSILNCVLDSVHVQKVQALAKLNEKIEMYAIDKVESSIFRTQSKYASEGEKCSAYFLSLEKKRYMEHNMKCVINDHGEAIYDQNRILEEQTKFYQKLYEKDESIKFQLKPSKEERLLTTAEKEFYEQPFTKEEFFDAVMTLKSNKVPGLDGLTIKFYRKFSKYIADPLIDMFMFSFENRLLPELVRQGLISLLPKKSKDTRYVKNMRPLTLLNNDYKILAKAIDNRLREVLPNIIGPNQTGFVKGRKISHNVRKSIDIIDYAIKEWVPMILLSIDMEKCFDHLEHEAIIKSLEYFNFGQSFIQWVGLISKYAHRILGSVHHYGQRGVVVTRGAP